MRVVIAPDKFKGSLTALQAAAGDGARRGRGVRRGIRSTRCPWPTAAKGPPHALVAATGGSYREAQVTGPLGEPVVARFGLLGDGRTAVLEMAAASGLVLVPPEKRNPLITTTRGTGELLLSGPSRVRRAQRRGAPPGCWSADCRRARRAAWRHRRL